MEGGVWSPPSTLHDQLGFRIRLRVLDLDLVNGRALLVGHLLAIDGLVVHLDVVVHLEDGLLQQHLLGQLVGFVARALGAEVDADALDVHVRAVFLDRVRARALDAGAERAQSLELDGNAFEQQVAHAVDDVLEHQYQHLIRGQLAVFTQVTGKALQVQSVARKYSS